MNRILLYLMTVLAGAAVTGCNIMEDESDCTQNVLLSFSFTVKGEERFARDVSSLSVFVFDQAGLFVGRWDEYDNTKFNANYRMVLPLRAGYYNCIVWGGLDETSYYVSRRDGTHDIFSPVVGETHMDDLNLKLRCQSVSVGGTQEHTVDYQPANLFHGSLLNVYVQPTISGETKEVPLIRNNKQINLGVKGLPPATTRASAFTNIDTWLEAANGWYTRNNEIDNPCNTYKYKSRNHGGDTQWMRTELHTLRMKYGSPHMMTIWNNDTDSEYYSVDLLNDVIKKVPAYATQAAVDAESVFNVEIELIDDGDSNLSVKVSVNGWDVSTSGTGIQ